jgi:anaerobic selenocysteine-containing dehydrogenase
VGECRGALDVYKGLSERLGMGDTFHWSSEKELVKDLLEPCPLNFEHLHKTKPEGDFYQEKTYETPEGAWRTPTKKIEIYSQALADVGFDPLPTYLEPEKSPQGKRWKELGEKYPLILSTGQRDLWYTASQMHHIDWLRERRPTAVAEIGPKTAAEYKITHGQDVYVETDRGQARMRAYVDDRIAEGVVLVPHGWSGEQNCNLLTDCRPESREPIMGYPTWKSQLCTIRSAE